MKQALVKCCKMRLTIARFTAASVFDVVLLRTRLFKVAISSEVNPVGVSSLVRTCKAFSKTSKASHLGPPYRRSLVVTVSKNSTREGASFANSMDGPYTTPK